MQAGVAVLVEEPVGAALGHAREIRDGDREEVEHVADRRPVEVAVRLDAAVEGDDGVVDGARELPLRDRAGVLIVSRTAPCTCGAQRSE